MQWNKNTRREFIVTSSAAAAGLTLVPGLLSNVNAQTNAVKLTDKSMVGIQMGAHSFYDEMRLSSLRAFGKAIRQLS